MSVRWSQPFLVAFPSPKPLALVTLADADNASALTFVKQRLYDVDLGIKFSKNQTALVERLGGRASDLESVSDIGIDALSHLLIALYSLFTRSVAD